MSKHSSSKRGGWRLRREAEGGFIQRGHQIYFVPGKLTRSIREGQTRALLRCAMEGHHYHPSFPDHRICLRCGAYDFPIAGAVTPWGFYL